MEGIPPVSPHSWESPQATGNKSSYQADSGKTIPIMNSPLAKMLGPSATPQEVEQFFNSINQGIISEIRKDQAKMHEVAEKLKRALDGDDD